MEFGQKLIISLELKKKKSQILTWLILHFTSTDLLCRVFVGGGSRITGSAGKGNSFSFQMKFTVKLGYKDIGSCDVCGAN
jgi:hypothetical protein